MHAARQECIFLHRFADLDDRLLPGHLLRQYHASVVGIGESPRGRGGKRVGFHAYHDAVLGD